MKQEIKLYLLTKFFDALFNGNIEEVERQLRTLLETPSLPEEYWNKWFNRYKAIELSKEVQVSLLKNAGYSYRKIQNMIGVSPNTVQRITTQYDIDYTELEDTYRLEDMLNRLGARLKKAGVEIW